MIIPENIWIQFLVYSNDLIKVSSYCCVTVFLFHSTLVFPWEHEFFWVWGVLILPANAGDVRDSASTPGLGWSPGGGSGNPLQYSLQSWTAALKHCPSPAPRVYSNSCPLSWWCHPTISSSIVPFSSCLQSFPASGSFPVSQFFSSGGQSIGVSASASVLPMNIHNWFPLGLTGLISLQSKGLSRVFSNTTVQKHQFFGAQLSLWSNSHIYTWLLEKS